MKGRMLCLCICEWKLEQWFVNVVYEFVHIIMLFRSKYLPAYRLEFHQFCLNTTQHSQLRSSNIGTRPGVIQSHILKTLTLYNLLLVCIVETFSFALHNLYRIHTWALLSTIYWEQYLLPSFYENPNKYFAIAIALAMVSKSLRLYKAGPDH